MSGLVDLSANELLLEQNKPGSLNISNLLKMLGKIFLLHFGKALSIVLFSWRVDDQVPEVIELLPLLCL